MRVPGRLSLGLVASAFLAASQVGCADNGDAREHAKPSRRRLLPRAPSIADPLATIGDEKITLANVRARVGDQLDQLDIQYRRARDKLIGGAVDTIIRSRLLEAESKRTGKTEDDWLRRRYPAASSRPKRRSGRGSMTTRHVSADALRSGSFTDRRLPSESAPRGSGDEARGPAARRAPRRGSASSRIACSSGTTALQHWAGMTRRSRWSSSPIFSARFASSPHRR